MQEEPIKNLKELSQMLEDILTDLDITKAIITIYKNIMSKLPLDMVRLVESYCDPETDYYRDKIIELSKKYDISRFGYMYNDIKRFEIGYKTFDYKNCVLNIMDCMNQIPYVVKPMKTVYNVGSYGGKHYIEDYRKKSRSGDCYISNGEFIIAMLLCGYTMKTYYNSPNPDFRASYITEKVEKVKKGKRAWLG